MYEASIPVKKFLRAMFDDSKYPYIPTYPSTYPPTYLPTRPPTKQGKFFVIPRWALI